MTMFTQLPFHKDNDFQHLNFFMRILIVSIVNIAGCVEYLDYQRQSKVPILSSSVIRTVTPIKASRKKLSLVFKDANLSMIFFSVKHLHTNVNSNHGVQTMYHGIPSKTAKRTGS